MSELIEVKVRPVGTSLGLLLPKAVVRQEGLRPGQKIAITILKPPLLDPAERRRLIGQAFGMAKGTKPFRRGKRDREF